MPLRGKIHRDAVLENVSINYKPDGFLSGEFPTVPVVRESDIYYVYSRDSMRIEETLRQKGKANRATWDLSTSSYQLEDHALMDLVYDKDRENADRPIKLDIDTTEILTQKLMLRYEKSLATLLQTVGNWSNNMSLSTSQNFATNTTNPITLYDTATAIIVQQSGRMPNVIVLPFTSFQLVKENSATVDRIKFTSADSITPQMLARLFNVERVLVPRVTEYTGQEGLADTTTNQSFIWTDSSFVGYVDPSPGLKKVTSWMSFTKSNEGGDRPRVTRWREEMEEADAIRVQKQYQHKAVATMCGFVIQDTR